jgi:RNA polymerase sigma-70 factor, ECF subfamily
MIGSGLGGSESHSGRRGGMVPEMTTRTAIGAEANELRAALASDSAFESWYRRTLPRVYSYLLSRGGNDAALAEELTQLTFIAAVQGRSQFDGRSDTVTWLCAIARHKLADHFRVLEREERRRTRMELREIRMGSLNLGAPELDDRAAIAEALGSLPVAQRAVLTFVVLDDLPVAEAARLLGKSVGATQSLLHRARDGFRRAYVAEPGDD